MVLFNQWVTESGSGGRVAPTSLQTGSMARRRWVLINKRPSVITILRGSTTLDGQTVRIEYSTTEREVGSRAGSISSVRDMVVFGVKNHPDGVADTDIQRGDEFQHQGRMHRVLDVYTVTGGIEAFCEAVE